MKKAMVLIIVTVMVLTAFNASAWWYPRRGGCRCTDTDGGKNYEVKGTVKDYRGRSYTDFCRYGKLYERYCRYGRFVGTEKVTCPGGCVNGACVSIPDPVCGNGVVEPGETCDEGANNGVRCIPPYGGSCTYCLKYCKTSTIPGEYCGDGIKNGPEECDDGNDIDGDGCTDCVADCTENWSCTAWGECQTTVTGKYGYINSVKYRTCTDLNACGTEYNKPPEGTSCDCTATWVKMKDEINIGDPSSEAGHNLQNWGPIEPDTHGGNWGYCNHSGIILPKCSDGNCRVVSSVGTGDTASFTLDLGGPADASNSSFKANRLVFYVLKGISFDDDFEIYIDGVKVYTFIDDGNRNWNCGNEWWQGHVLTDMDLDDFFPVNGYWHVGGLRNVTIISTAPHWSGYNTYGQIGVTRIESEWEEREISCT